MFQNGHELSYAHPQNKHEEGVEFRRELDTTNGSIYWCYNGEPLIGDNGVVLFEIQRRYGGSTRRTEAMEAVYKTFGGFFVVNFDP